MSFIEFMIVVIFLPAVFSFYTYWERREKVEATCIKESKLKTFMDEYVTNAILIFIVVSVVQLVSMMIDVWLNGAIR